MARPAILTTTDASGGATTSAVYVCDTSPSYFNVGFGVKVSGTVSFTVQHTYDDPFASTFTPSGATWFDNATVAAKTANTDGSYSNPVRAIRLKQNSGNGNCTMTLFQIGIGS